MPNACVKFQHTETLNPKIQALSPDQVRHQRRVFQTGAGHTCSGCIIIYVIFIIVIVIIVIIVYCYYDYIIIVIIIIIIVFIIIVIMIFIH
jgi:hypothetical protein